MKRFVAVYGIVTGLLLASWVCFAQLPQLGVGPLGGGPTILTWDPAGASNVNLTGGNLIATSTAGGFAGFIQGLAAKDKTTGKWYVELTPSNGFSNWMGVIDVPSGYPTNWIWLTAGAGLISVSGSTAANDGVTSNGTVASIALDLINKNIWFRVSCGDWNNNSSYDPAANTGGVSVPGTQYRVTANMQNSGETITMNSGPSYACGVPSGFLQW